MLEAYENLFSSIKCEGRRFKMPNQHKIIKCLVCEKWMRKDNAQRHGSTHKDLLSLPEEEIEIELKSRHEEKVETERKRQKIVAIAEKLDVSIPEELKVSDEVNDDEDTHQRLIRNNSIYLENVRIGKEIAHILATSDIHEESLNKQDKEALRLYRNQRLRLDITDQKLRPWQIKVFNIIEEQQSERKIVWVYDVKGNTGKSWFQNYVEAYYGYQRVFMGDLRIKHKDICNILRKRGLSTINIFMFNDARSTGEGDVNCYRILEDIKDGAITSSKYDNDIIKVNTPNIVIVFSNVRPNKDKLSKDRWMIIDISSQYSNK